MVASIIVLAGLAYFGLTIYQKSPAATSKNGGTPIWSEQIGDENRIFTVSLVGRDIHDVTLQNDEDNRNSIKAERGNFTLVSSEGTTQIDQFDLGERTMLPADWFPSTSFLVFTPQDVDLYRTPKINGQSITWTVQHARERASSFGIFFIKSNGKLAQAKFINEKGEIVDGMIGEGIDDSPYYSTTTQTWEPQYLVKYGDSNCFTTDTYNSSGTTYALIHRSEWCEGLGPNGGPKPTTEQNFNQ